MYAVGLHYDHGHSASHENFMKWWLSWLWSRFGAKSSRDCKSKWLSGLAIAISHFI